MSLHSVTYIIYFKYILYVSEMLWHALKYGTHLNQGQWINCEAMASSVQRDSTCQTHVFSVQFTNFSLSHPLYLSLNFNAIKREPILIHGLCEPWLFRPPLVNEFDTHPEYRLCSSASIIHHPIHHLATVFPEAWVCCSSRLILNELITIYLCFIFFLFILEVLFFFIKHLVSYLISIWEYRIQKCKWLQNVFHCSHKFRTLQMQYN